MYFWKIKVTFIIIIIIQAILMPEKLSNSDILSLCCWKKKCISESLLCVC